MSATPRLADIGNQRTAQAAAAGIELAHAARIRFTSTLGLPTFSAAFLQSSAFTISGRKEQRIIANSTPLGNKKIYRFFKIGFDAVLLAN